jgi:hypothetical protein
MAHATAEVWAVYSDGVEDNGSRKRRVRHVHAVKTTIDEAKDVVRWYAETGFGLAIKRFDSEADARAFEIDDDAGEFDALDRLHAIADYYSDVAS